MNQRHPHLPFTPQSDALRDGVPDVQGRADVRHIAIDQVGIRGIRHPLRVQSADGSVQHTVGMFSMTVNLRGDVKGTHMSRFVELLEAERAGKAALDPAGLHSLLQRMVAKLEVNEGVISIEFPYFIEKSAPVSGVTSLLDYQVTLTGRMRSGQFSSTTKVVAPVTSLCPCSKEISDYGAHNQR
ncbi:MAG: GTP cyclohydrolase, FolE2/MptA family, partial [Burkholderiales bacterium]